ncbi:MAG TPA: hypothetical protein VGI27_03410, partial [Solirubrobacteraceae bacterium]
DERVVAMRASYHGSGIGGRGRFAFEAGFVTLVEGGLSLSSDAYEYEDNEAMLARFAELSRSSSRADASSGRARFRRRRQA